LYIEFWWLNLRKGDQLEDVNPDGTVILKWFLINEMQERGLNSCGSGKGRVAGLFENVMNIPVT
jgi:hypothetical protein